MPDLEHNQRVWNEGWDWSTAGEEWSRSWGGTPALWYGALHPRIGGFLSAGTILEIAPGFGRWSDYLRRYCDRLILVDMTAKCIDGCRQRFADQGGIEFHVNDGLSLPMVDDSSVDFAFSFDSLVHADRRVLRSYLGELARVLRPDGVAFLHHSNAGAYPRLSELTRRVPEPHRRRLVRAGALIDLYAWRSEDVSAQMVAAMAEEAGLVCLSQERIVWENGPWLTDALSVLALAGSARAHPTVKAANRSFRTETRRIGSLYRA